MTGPVGRRARTRMWVVRRRGTLALAAGLVLGFAAGAGAVVLRGREQAAGVLERGELVVVSGLDESDGRQRHRLVEQWNADPAHEHIQASLMEVAGGTDAQRAEMVRLAESGVDVDVFNLDVTLTAEFAERGFISALDPEPDLSGFLAKPRDTCRYDGRVWAMPFNTDAALIYYNTKLVGKGAQTNWRAIESTTDRVLAAGTEGQELMAGYAGQFGNAEALTVNAMELIWTLGGEVVDRDGQVVVDSGATREAMRQLAAAMGQTNPRLILEASRVFTEQQTTEAFRDGKVLFMRNWPVAYRQLASEEEGKPAVEFDTAPLSNSVLGGQNLAVAHRSRYPRAARALVEFLTSERSQQLLFERGGFAATREIVYHDQAVLNLYPYTKGLLTAVQGARPRPVTARYADFSAVFRWGVSHALDHDGAWPDGFAQALRTALEGAPPG